jgi:hypothetical protein
VVDFMVTPPWETGCLVDATVYHERSLGVAQAASQ